MERVPGGRALSIGSWMILIPLQAPDYHKLIANPMDFSTIKVNIKKYTYTDAAEVLEDLRLVFTNCEAYNETNTDEYKAGQRLCRLFVKRVKEMHLDRVLNRQAAQQASGSKSPRRKSSGRRT